MNLGIRAGDESENLRWQGIWAGWEAGYKLHHNFPLDLLCASRDTPSEADQIEFSQQTEVGKLWQPPKDEKEN